MTSRDAAVWRFLRGILKIFAAHFQIPRITSLALQPSLIKASIAQVFCCWGFAEGEAEGFLRSPPQTLLKTKAFRFLEHKSDANAETSGMRSETSKTPSGRIYVAVKRVLTGAERALGTGTSAAGRETGAIGRKDRCGSLGSKLRLRRRILDEDCIAGRSHEIGNISYLRNLKCLRRHKLWCENDAQLPTTPPPTAPFHLSLRSLTLPLRL